MAPRQTKSRNREEIAQMGKENRPRLQRLANQNYADKMGQLQPRRQNLVQFALISRSRKEPRLHHPSRAFTPESQAPQQRFYGHDGQIYALLGRSPQRTERFYTVADEINST